MTGSKIKALVLLLSVFIVASVQVHAVTFTVRQDGQGNFKSIQAAIDAAGMGDEVVIMDAAIYEEQVTIDSTKSGLILRSEVPTAVNKPTIRFKDTENVHPVNFTESQDTATINYHRNGALRILSAVAVRIEGLIIDGGGPFPFAYPAVWECITPLFHGNAALDIDQGGEIIVRDCELRNAYFGIYCHDRNEGGIFAKANPGDLFPENVIPLSGFARAGNHLFEYNRICCNSWGIYFHSLWDMGSTVRYNLFYNNHHIDDALAAKVVAMPGGSSQAGGAILFNDVMFTPVSIHNNTFWHNYLLFADLSHTGGQHLVFNNIYSTPFRLWSTDPLFPNPTIAIDQLFINRMYSSVYGCQAEPPETTRIIWLDSVYDAEAGRYVGFYTTITAFSRIRIMSGMEQVKKGMDYAFTVHLISEKDTVIKRTFPDVIQPGNPITAMTNLKPFPESSNVRWAEVPFLSTDPSSADFLVPDWNNELVELFIVDQGWPASGVKDPDGSVADLGAIPMGGGRADDVVTIRPIKPIIISDHTANLSFNITPRIGTMTEPRFTMLRFVKSIDTASQAQFVPAENIITIPFPTQPPVRVGTNDYLISLPESRYDIAFFELIVEGTGINTRPFTSSTGFIPYRKFDYTLEVAVLDTATKQPITEIRVGAPCILRTTARATSEALFPNKVDPTDINLQSPFDLLTPAGTAATSFPGGITGTADMEVVFTRVPDGGGMEYVIVSGKWVNGTKVIAFLGSSAAVRVLPGPAGSIAFQKPLVEYIAPGRTVPLKVQAFDKYRNKAGAGHAVICKSAMPGIGTIVDTIISTDSSGMATFRAIVTDGALYDKFSIVAALVSDPAVCDTVELKIIDVAVTAPPAAFQLKPRELLCELIDLRGRVVKRTMVYRQVPLTGKNPFSGMAGRGMYLVRLTDTVTGKVTTRQRLLLSN